MISIADYAREISAPVEPIPVARASKILTGGWPETFERYFTYGDLAVARLPEILFFPRKRVFTTPNGRFLTDATQPHLNGIAGATVARAFRSPMDRIRRIEGPVLAFGGSDNYFHWCLSWMTKLFALSRSDSMGSTRGIVLCGPPRRFKTDSLSALPAFENADLHFLQGEDPVRIMDAIVPSMYTNPQHVLPHLDWLNGLFPELSETQSPRRLYVSRWDAPMDSRRVVNEDAVMDLLHGYGFEARTLTDLPMSGQAALFAGADHIVSPHGAGLTNIIFCQRQPHICEINAPGCFTRVFRSLGLARRAERYDMLRSRSLENRPGNKSDIEVDLRALELLLTGKWGLRKA
jgi:capsular polysaccharide biosynthesis protein